MLEKCDYREARDLMISHVAPVGIEKVPLSSCAGRVLAREAAAQEDIPPFDRSPYDGYAFRAEDVKTASAESPVTLKIVDYIAAGDVPHRPVTAGTAAHLMTGAPIPEGADAVLPFERTRFTDEEVTIDTAVKPGSNVIYAGEDVKRGTVLCGPGALIDAGLAGTLAGQGIFAPCVYKKPLVGVISTGSEILEEDEAPVPGRIYNSNRYSLQAACELAGCETVYIGTARDDEAIIAELIAQALKTCDAVILSGGVSVGDFDCTPAAMEKAGVRILVHGLALKPGMAGAYGIYTGDSRKSTGYGQAEGFGQAEESGQTGHSVQADKIGQADRIGQADNPGQADNSGPASDAGGIPVFGLSGNPAACMTAFYAVVLPVLRRQMGFALEKCLPPQIRVCLKKEYSRKNQSSRLLRGRVDPAAVVQEMKITGGQGNQVLSSLAGSNAFAEIPAGMAVKAEEPVDAFLIDQL